MDELGETYSGLPGYLKRFCVAQRYSEYTAEYQAVWRAVMRQASTFLGEHAHPSYARGLAECAIPIDDIPHIRDVDAALRQFGWGAVAVDGFLPPAIFMDFQARRVLPISSQMRTLDHIFYTPAPDILHEAAGHVPFLVDETYAGFLQEVGELGTLALGDAVDHDVYEAVRGLSIVKEHPNSHADDVRAAERELDNALAAQMRTAPSEANRLARLHWWTVEYGLVLNSGSPRIFGAGLLSSLTEARRSIDPARHAPLTVHCADQAYDITQMQPKYFVAESWGHLREVLREFSQGLATVGGGLSGAEKAVASKHLATARYVSGLQVSGTLTEAVGRDGALAYIQATGATTLSYKGRVLPGHTARRHPHGFGSPVGRLKGGVALENLDESGLCAHGITEGELCDLEFESGIRVAGRFTNLIRREGRTLVMTFVEATVTDGDTVRFQPSWGEFDMAVGADVDSVHAGPASRSQNQYKPSRRSSRTRAVQYTPVQRAAESLYSAVRELRETGGGALLREKLRDNSMASLTALYDRLCALEGDKWLMLMELYEILCDWREHTSSIGQAIRSELDAIGASRERRGVLIRDGLALCDAAVAA